MYFGGIQTIPIMYSCIRIYLLHAKKKAATRLPSLPGAEKNALLIANEESDLVPLTLFSRVRDPSPYLRWPRPFLVMAHVASPSSTVECCTLTYSVFGSCGLK